MNRFCTYVFQVPKAKGAPSPFFDELLDLMKKHKVEAVSQSTSDELSYVDELSAELAQHIGEIGVEDFRQEFERKERAGKQ
ncbi:hypothetical protein [Stutzerimonas stutzeri]|uniref:hypothetical protein n=1 Tax=Stutzerimonas stutzeri TaxID=316 RepID=UPI001BCCB65A|nr:hypothetical protein [Stutzerimonas stutzeri]